MKNHPRKTTVRLLESADNEMISWEYIARAALDYMSEAEVYDMCRANDILFVDEDEDVDFTSQGD